MSQKTIVKQGTAAVLLCALTEGICLLMLGWGGAAGRIDAQALLPPLRLATALAGISGACFLRRKGWRLCWAALLAGPGCQLLLMGAGALAYGGAGLGGGRWQLMAMSLAAALLTGLLPMRAGGGKRRRRRQAAGRKR